MMPIERIPDWERRVARQDAFWHREIIDRPVVDITFPRVPGPGPVPRARGWASEKERWLDSEYQAELAADQVANTECRGDALPFAWPNLGPDLFSAFLGCEIAFRPETSWSSPFLSDLDAGLQLDLAVSGEYWRKLIEMTDAFLEAGRNRFYVGLTDLHANGDAAAALRGAEQLCLDLVEQPAAVRRLVDHLNRPYLRVCDFYHDKLEAAGQGFTAHPRIVSSRRWYVAANDFSAMVSPRMFEETFLPAIVEECRGREATIYHVDGRHALRHLDALLAVPELGAIQWTYGAGEGRASDWLWVYRKCQEAGKAIQITTLEPDELDLFMEHLRPEGLWILMGGVENGEQADLLVRRISRWK